MAESIYDLFETDAKLEAEGFIFDITPKISFTLARAGGANLRYQKAMEVKTRKHRSAIENNTISVELANQLMVEAFAETVVLGWKGITDKKGKKVPFTPENAVNLFTKLPDLFIDVREAAAARANFSAKEVADDAGN